MKTYELIKSTVEPDFFLFFPMLRGKHGFLNVKKKNGAKTYIR